MNNQTRQLSFFEKNNINLVGYANFKPLPLPVALSHKESSRTSWQFDHELTINNARASAERLLVNSNEQTVMTLVALYEQAQLTCHQGGRVKLIDIAITEWTIKFWQNVLKCDLYVLSNDFPGSTADLKFVKYPLPLNFDKKPFEFKKNDESLCIGEIVYPLNQVASRIFKERSEYERLKQYSKLLPYMSQIMFHTLYELDLIAKNNPYDIYSENRCCFIQTLAVKEQVRNLGLALYKAEGMYGLFNAGKCVPFNGGDNRDLEIAWDGIGKWSM